MLLAHHVFLCGPPHPSVPPVIEFVSVFSLQFSFHLHIADLSQIGSTQLSQRKGIRLKFLHFCTFKQTNNLIYISHIAIKHFDTIKSSSAPQNQIKRPIINEISRKICNFHLVCISAFLNHRNKIFRYDSNVFSSEKSN